MKLAILGGGGFRVPLVYQALSTGRAGSGALIDDLWLYDTDPGRLAVIESVLRQLPGPVAPHVTSSLNEALDGADFVFSAIRVGGLAGRIADERAAIEAGLIGQETTGPGGLAYALYERARRSYGSRRGIRLAARRTQPLAPGPARWVRGP